MDQKVIRGYDIKDRIGEGGFGVVYRAYQPMVEREVVVKAIHPLYINDPTFIRNFEAEAQLIARLEHINIVPLYDYWREPSGAYLVMRFLRGGNLMTSLQDNGAWPAAEVAHMVQQIASALAFAHANEIVHQDVKPANILLDEAGNSYLSDFGIALNLKNSLNLAADDDKDIIHGSPAYIPPEQITRSEITPRADIYSLGIVAFEALTGHYPFDRSTIDKLLQQQLSQKLPPLEEFASGLPAGLNAVLRRATEKVPGNRYETIMAMASDFQDVVERGSDAAVLARAVSKSPPKASTDDVQHNTAIIDFDSIGIPISNPYKGLRPFTEADTRNFFGRDDLIASIVSSLTEGRQFVAVVGPSGSGKSSVVHAGVIARLRKSHAPRWANTFIVDMVPGSQPVTNLKLALLSVATDLSAHDLNLSDGIGPALNRVLPSGENTLLLVVDQFEEVFTQTTDEEERQQFIKLIATEDDRLRVIVTLRADFYDRPLMYPAIGHLIQSSTQVVLPLDRQAMEQIIVAPASQIGLAFEPGLVDLILEDMEEQARALPLLQYMLTELYERRDELNQVTFQSYQAIGRVAGAITRRAQALYTDMTLDEQAATQAIFLRLVTLGENEEDTRRRARYQELFTLGVQRAVVESVLEIFGKYRLLTFDNDPETRAPTVEIAHEALLRQWQTLRMWLNDNRDDLRLQRKLAERTREWLQNKQSADYLVRGSQLEQFETLTVTKALTLSADETDYVRRSVALRRRQQRTIGLSIVTLIVITAIAVGAALVAFNQRNEAQTARERADREASISRSRQLATSAIINREHIDQALLLSLEALAYADTFDARNSLLTLLQDAARLQTTLYQPDAVIRTVAVSDAYIALGSQAGIITLWDRTSHQLLERQFVDTGAINALAFSSDGAFIASGGDGGATVWQVADEQQVARFEQSVVDAVAFSPDGNWFSAGTTEGTIILWDIDDESEPDTLSAHADAVYSLTFSPDGTRLASAGGDNMVRLWDLESGEAITELSGHTDWVLTVDFHPTADLLVSGGADNAIIFWDASSGEALTRPLVAHADWVRDLTFTQAGDQLVMASNDGLLSLWDVNSASVQAQWSSVDNLPVRDIALADQAILSAIGRSAVYSWSLTKTSAVGDVWGQHTDQLLTLAFNPSGDQFAYAGGFQTDFSVVLRSTTSDHQQALEAHTEAVTGLAFDSQRRRLISAGADGQVIFWDTATGEADHMLTDISAIFSMVWNPSQLIVGSNDGSITFWNATGDEQIAQIPAHDSRVTALALAPDGMTLASGGRDGTIRLWNPEDGTAQSIELSGHTDGVLSLDFSPDGTLLASSSRDLSVQLWDVTTGQPLREPITAFDNWAMSVTFSPDGAWLAVGDGSRQVTLWDVATGRQLGGAFTGHTDWVNAVAFNPTGDYLISGGRDGTVIRWDVTLSDWQQIACAIANRNLTPRERTIYLQSETARSTCRS